MPLLDWRCFMTDSNSTALDSTSRYNAPEFIETSSSMTGDASLANNNIRYCAYGSWGGIEVLRQTRTHLDHVAGIPPKHSLAFLLVNSLDQPHPLKTLSTGQPNSVFSPTRESLTNRIDFAFTKSLLFWPFLERAYIDKAIARVYSPTAVIDSHTGHDQMALIYAVASLGEAFETPFLWNVGISGADVSWTG